MLCEYTGCHVRVCSAIYINSNSIRKYEHESDEMLVT